MAYTADRTSELRRVDGSSVALAGNVESVTFSPDNRLIVVNYYDKPGELWEKGSTRPLVTLTNLTSFAYNAEASRLIVQHSTGQVYVLDTVWLSSIAGYPQTLSEAEFFKQTCTMLRAHLDDKELQAYLDNRPPKACR